MKKASKILGNIALIATFCAIFCACSDDKNKHLVVATAANFAPFEFRAGGEFAGIDIEIAQKIAQKVGKKLIIKDTEFASVLSAVEGGNAHMAISGLTINPARARIVNFSNTYFDASQMVLVRKDDARFGGIGDAQELKARLDLLGAADKDGAKKPLRIGVQAGTTGQFYAQGSSDFDFPGIKNAEVVTYEHGGMALLELSGGKLDALIIDEMPARTLASRDDSVILLPHALTQEQYAIAVNKNDALLLDAVNSVLLELKETGQIVEIFSKYYK